MLENNNIFAKKKYLGCVFVAPVASVWSVSLVSLALCNLKCVAVLQTWASKRVARCFAEHAWMRRYVPLCECKCLCEMTWNSQFSHRPRAHSNMSTMEHDANLADDEMKWKLRWEYRRRVEVKDGERHKQEARAYENGWSGGGKRNQEKHRNKNLIWFARKCKNQRRIMYEMCGSGIRHWLGFVPFRSLVRLVVSFHLIHSLAGFLPFRWHSHCMQ